MSNETWHKFDWAIPVVMGALLAHWPHWTQSLHDQGGYYAVAGAVMTIAGRYVYQTYLNPPAKGRKS